MTRKHFNRLAAELLAARPIHAAERSGWEKAVHAVSDACWASNPNFDPARFAAACGVTA